MDCNDIELDMVIQAAHNMVTQTKKGENKINEMLSRAHRVAEKMSSMYRYEKMLEDMRSLTVNGSRRKIILNDLQRENRQIMALQDENRQLRESTDECLAAIREIVDTHNEIKQSIRYRDQYLMVDEADEVLYEMSNRPTEGYLKNKARDFQKVMNEMARTKGEEDHKALLAVKKNKDYREIVELACISKPGAVRILQNAIKRVFKEIDEKSQNMENKTKDLEEGDGDNRDDEDVMNRTIQQNPDFSKTT